MKTHLLVSLVVFSLAHAAQAAAPSCEALFSQPKAAAPQQRLRELVKSKEFSQQDAKLIKELAKVDGIAINKIVERFEELVKYARSEKETPEQVIKAEADADAIPGRIMTAANSSLITLASASAKSNLSMKETVAAINVVGRSVSAMSRPIGERRFELWLPSRILLSLTELSLRYDIKPNFMAAKYNGILREVIDGKVDTTDPLLRPPMDQALHQLRVSLM